MPATSRPTNRQRTGKALPRSPHAPSKTELLVAQVRNAGSVEETVDIYEALEGVNLPTSRGIEEGGSITTNAPMKIVMWKPTAKGDYSRRVVSSQNLMMHLQSGWLAFCPRCGGECGADPNDCPAGDPVLFRKCPVCAKRVFDPGVNVNAPGSGEGDEFEITNEGVTDSTPKTRTMELLRDHMLAYHPRESRSYPTIVGLSGVAQSINERTRDGDGLFVNPDFRGPAVLASTPAGTNLEIEAASAAAGGR